MIGAPVLIRLLDRPGFANLDLCEGFERVGGRTIITTSSGREMATAETPESIALRAAPVWPAPEGSMRIIAVTIGDRLETRVAPLAGWREGRPVLAQAPLAHARRFTTPNRRGGWLHPAGPVISDDGIAYANQERWLEAINERLVAEGLSEIIREGA